MISHLRTNNIFKRNISFLLVGKRTTNNNIIRNLSQNNSTEIPSERLENPLDSRPSERLENPLDSRPPSFYYKTSDIDKTKKYIDIKYDMILSDLEKIKDKQNCILIFTGTIYLHLILTSIGILLR